MAALHRTLAALALVAAAPLAWAQATPAGLWKTIDDETKTERSLVRISDNGGVFSGRIEKLLGTPPRPDAPPPVCTQCTDERKGKPIIGMNIIEGVKKNADEPYWDGGTVLDPGSGKTYKLRLTPKDGGKALEVRGFIGPFFRNQTWLRVE